MKRENRYGVGLVAAGILTLPFLAGIPLLVVGLLLLNVGGNIRADRWIRVLFPVAVAAMALSVVLLLVIDIEGQPSAERGIALSIFCVAPGLLGVMIGIALAALTIGRFKSLTPACRFMGLSLGILCGVALGIAIILEFPWQTLMFSTVVVGVWLGISWWNRRGQSVPPTAPAREAGAPVPPRTRRPLFGLLAWALPVLAAILGVIIVYGLGSIVDTSDFKGMGAGMAILGAGFVPLILALVASPVFAVISLRRRERHPAMAIILLAAYILPALAMLVLYAVDFLAHVL